MWGVLSTWVLMGGALVGCTSKSDVAGTGQKSGRVVNLAIWSNYLSPEIQADFEKRTGIKVQVANYSSNEELLAKLQAGAAGYDVIVPSDYMVDAMVKQNLLKKLDRSQLPNVKRLDPRLLKKHFDPDNQYSVPYDWGSTGIAVNKTLYSGKITGWKDVFGNAALKGKVTLLDDVREGIGAALKSLGLSMNTRNPADLARAKALLIKAKPSIKAFSSETKMALVQGEVSVAHAYVSDALQARHDTGGKIDYVIPEEGATLWIDSVAIPASAPHPQEALELINSLIDVKTGLTLATGLFLSPVNLDVVPQLPKELQDDPALFPADAVRAKLETLEDLGDDLKAWDRVWTEVKTQ